MCERCPYLPTKKEINGGVPVNKCKAGNRIEVNGTKNTGRMARIIMPTHAYFSGDTDLLEVLKEEVVIDKRCGAFDDPEKQKTCSRNQF